MDGTEGADVSGDQVNAALAYGLIFAVGLIVICTVGWLYERTARKREEGRRR